MPLIVADSDIPYMDPVLGPIGSVIPVPGHRIGPEHVRNADALVVRSVTTVDAALLAGSSVRFVGSATSGIDHVDTEWLSHQGIGFANAAGANAESVVEYVLAAMALGLERRGGHLEELTLGVVGCGRIGGRLVRRARALGFTVLANDPPLVRSGSAPADVACVPLTDLLKRSDIVSVHVPLVRGGNDPTVSLIDESAMSNMKSGAWLIQSSRGGTVDEAAAVRARLRGHLAFLTVDVWEDEPDPQRRSLETVDIATPHIAGYSRDAKLTGIRMIRDALAASLGVGRSEAGTTLAEHPPDLPDPSHFSLGMETGGDRTDVFRRLVPLMYDLAADDARFRSVFSETDEAMDRAESFHRLRATYPPRWSFSRYGLGNRSQEMSTAFLQEGIGIGAQVEGEPPVGRGQGA